MARGRALLKLPGVVAGALLLPFRRSKRSAGLSGDAAKRREEMLGLAADVTRTVGGARIRSLFRGKERKAELQRAALERATALAVEQLGNMKGLSMKLGQIMSYLSILSEEGEQQLSDLQSAVPPMDPELVTAVISEQLGTDAFASFEMEPIAAASVGQVHRARLRDGRVVAVKVQYPGVDTALAADLENMNAMGELSALTMKADLSEYFAMIGQSFMAELDYTLEQRNQQRLADMYRGHRFVMVPETVPSLCTPKVLVSEFVQGRRFQDAVQACTPEDRDRIGEIMYRFAFGCMMNGFFSGDPHPGNYLFPDDGRVCFLDFGMVIDISGAEHRAKIPQVIAGALHARQDLIDDGLRTLGFLPEGGPRGSDVWDELRGILVGPIEVRGGVRLDRHEFRKAMLRVMNPLGHLNRAGMKTDRFEPWAALWSRYAAGSLSSISKFAPEADWRRILAEIVDGTPPHTDIGRAWGSAPGGSAFRATEWVDRTSTIPPA